MNYRCATFQIPCGEFSVALDDQGTVVATTFGNQAELQARRPAARMVQDEAGLAYVGRQVAEFFAGERRAFDLPLAAGGTPFQLAVWSALQTIPFGETRSYQQIAVAIGSPQACRAVGAANGANPIALFIPCHRVIGANGSLTGFAAGERIKRQLLEHEQAAAFALA